MNDRWLRPLLAVLLLVGTAALLSSWATDDERPNDPASDPYTENRPELLAAAEITSLGGFPFGKTDTATIDALLATSDIRWIETRHFRLGYALGSYKVKQDEKKKIRAELARLAEKLPEVPLKPSTLDPWLRAHLIAQRMEDFWDRFLSVLRIEESVFPDGTKVWDMTTHYRGEGPFLGMKEKFEVLLLPSEAVSVTFLEENFGLRIRRTQRWNVTQRNALHVTIHTQDGQLRVDTALHGHIVFNLTHNFIDGLEFYAYETPVWLHEGLAHWFEREISPRWNSFDSSEGAIAEETRKVNWEPAVRKLVTRGDAPTMAQLVALREYADFELEHHFKTWSVIDYMMREHPNAVGDFLLAIKGITGENGIADGSGLPQVQRDLFQQLFGTTYAQFDERWATWVADTYSAR